MDETTSMLPKATPPPKKTSAGTWISIVFILGFGIALTIMGFTQMGRQCDQPLTIYLMLHGIAGVGAAIFFLVTEIMYLDSNDPEDDGSLKGIPKYIFYFVVVYVWLVGAVGCYFYFSSQSCEDTAFTTFRWSWSAVLLFLILASMMFSDVAGKVGGKGFAKIGNLLGALFQAIADGFKSLASVLEEGPADPENIPPSRSGAAVFAVYVSHAAFLWFFLYILFEAFHERNLACDKPLAIYLYVIGGVGSFLTYCHFLYDMFAGVKTREAIAKGQYWGAVIIFVVTIIWAILGFTWVQSSTTCHEDGGANNTYRISYLMSCLLFIFCGLCCLFILMGILDFLCSGRARLVLAVSQGDDDDEDDVQT